MPFIKALPHAIALFAASGLAHAQECIWTQLTPAGSLPSPRQSAALAYDSARARVILFGGRFGATNLGDTWEWDGVSWTLMPTTGPSPRATHAMAYHATRNRTYLFGGQTTAAPFKTWEWDGEQWTVLPDNNTDNSINSCMVYDSAHQRLFLFGSDGGPGFRELISPFSGIWVTLFIPGPNLHSAAAAYDSDRARILYFGGLPPFGTQTISSELWEFDASTPTGAWTFLGNAPIRRRDASAAYDPVRRRFIVSGGLGPDADGQYMGDTWEYDPAASTWTRRADDGPGHRSNGAMIYDPARDAVLHFGGRGPALGDFFNDLWQFRGQNSRAVILQSFPLGQSVVQGLALSLPTSAQGAKTFQWQRDGVSLVNGGSVSGAQSPTLSISPLAESDEGNYTLLMSGGCGTANPTVRIVVNNPLGCFANCDQSTVIPYLTANDWTCFINQFALGTSYANCDGSTGTPALTGSDFVCFIGAYAQGCP